MMYDDMSIKHIWKLIFWTAFFLGGVGGQTHPFLSLSTVGGLHIAGLFAIKRTPFILNPAKG